MAKRRHLKDTIADPMVKTRPKASKRPEEKPSQSLQKLVISAVSLVVGAAVGVLLNRYLKLF